MKEPKSVHRQKLSEGFIDEKPISKKTQKHGTEFFVEIDSYEWNVDNVIQKQNFNPSHSSELSIIIKFEITFAAAVNEIATKKQQIRRLGNCSQTTVFEGMSQLNDTLSNSPIHILMLIWLYACDQLSLSHSYHKTTI